LQNNGESTGWFYLCKITFAATIPESREKNPIVWRPLPMPCLFDVLMETQLFEAILKIKQPAK
jgi:hypothetical protein